MIQKKALILCILDGWGHSDEYEYNAIKQSELPNYSHLLKTAPCTLIETSGKAVGLPVKQMGNSEVGHMTIGAGRIIEQDLVKIDNIIQNGKLTSNPIVRQLINCLKSSGGTCHLIGMISDGGVHSHIDHIIALANIIKKSNIRLKLHAITDGRDTAPQSAISYIKKLLSCDINISSISGRFYAMDRDNRWDRTQLSYKTIVQGEGSKFSDPIKAIRESYAKNINDEFILPIVSQDYSGMSANDAFIMVNFRADRVRQLLSALVNDDFKEFLRYKIQFSYAVGMNSYSKELDTKISSIVPNTKIENNLGETLAKCGKSQLRIAETEKYAHITYFFNGGRENPYHLEDRILIASPNVATYDLQPEMSAKEITNQLIKAIINQKYDFICVNFANADMVGHTGNMEATKKACMAIDDCLGKIIAILEANNAEMIITADHGNAEQLFNNITLQPNTAHTLNPVPLIYVGSKDIGLIKGGLIDVAPTILNLMGIEQPNNMKGNSLIIPTLYSNNLS